ncbi:hypothetical protein B0F90DRAFT_852491 [Multifurca ochricompacta]|uniref:Uncharacterized protein n=1 Tax=Multifurca ochricompacta TaxID=376703 RepID=A0AAD4QIM7_9AGAM|nr:hypothetical protein B0F90DRAFT_852491 [Multifurca ochricompacta]
MSANHEETNTVKSFSVHSDAVHEDTSVGKKVGQGVFGALNVVHGIGEAIRGLAIDIADFGNGSGKSISEEGKAEVKEGVKQMESSVHR